MTVALLAAHEDWDVWTEWYDALLEGRLAESEAISLARVTLPEELWERGPKAVNAELKRLIEAEKHVPAPAADRRDFFLSYSTKDEATARRIASVARAGGYSLFAQFNDMPPGSNFVREMQRGLGLCNRMIAVLSPHYEASDHCQAEWAHFYARDPGGAKRAIVPLLIHPTSLNALSKQVVYVNLVGLTDADAEARIRAALAPHEPPDHEATRRALAEAASPRPVVDAEGRMDIDRNPVFDAEVPSDDLYELPNRQLALIRTLRAGLARSNAPPAMVKSALDEYYEEIEKRRLAPSLGLLNDQIATIEAERADDVDNIWCTGGIAKSLDRLCKNHELMRQHFPLDAERDRLYRDAPIDPNLIRDPAFLKASRATSAAMQEAAKDGAVTQDLAEAVERRDKQIQSIGATRASSDKDIFVAPEDRLAPPTLEKRILAQEAGFWDAFLQRSANVAQIGSSIDPVRQLLKILFGGW